MEIQDRIGACSSRPTCNILPFANQFRFTPVISKIKAPRLWDRKPSTPFLARPKSRKLWKRFRSSFDSMKTARQLAGDDEDELVTEINSSVSKRLFRGVKRRCLGNSCPGLGPGEEIERGRSFLETKWELDTTRRRKYAMNRDYDLQPMQPDTRIGGQEETSEEYLQQTDVALEISAEAEETLSIPSNEHDLISNGGDQDTDAPSDRQACSDLPTSPTEDVPSSPQPGEEVKSIGKSDAETVTDDGNTVALPSDLDCHLQDTPNSNATRKMTAGVTIKLEKASCIDHHKSPGLNGPFPAISVVIELKSQKAATEGKTIIAEEASLIRSALRSSALECEDEELLNDFLSRAKAKRAANAANTPKDSDKLAPADLLLESPTPRSRRALEELDTNSPSPLPPSPAKTDSSLVGADEDLKDAEPAEEPEPSPTRRRSSRMKPSKASQRRAPPAIPNQIPVRRPKGTEFVFLQRTEAQELALATRRNTKRNRGNAQMPKEMLQTLAQRQEDDSTVSVQRKQGTGKTVSWNERLVEYEPEGGPGDDVAEAVVQAVRSHVGARRAQGPRVARRSPCTGVPATAPPAPATPRARRLPPSGALSPANKLPSSIITASTDHSLIPTTINTSTDSEINQRKRLAPKAPSAAMLGKAKGTIARSRLPARTSTSKPTVSKNMSILHAGAGSTPMPKRVRARK